MTVEPDGGDLRARVRAVMDAHWQPEGYTVPNGDVYPFAWLWDSCFHSIIWAALGDADRAVIELEHVFRLQDDDGFVPHIDYQRDPDHHSSFWNRREGSTITQPPMYGHAVAELRRRGIDVPEAVIDRARAGVGWFLEHRRHESGLIRVVHSWETGCDDSARFDHWGAADHARWYEMKGELVAGRVDPFDCAPVSLSALVAWNQRELDGAADATLVDALAARWDRGARTWIDAGQAEATSGRTRTLEALLAVLVDPRPEVVDVALSETADPAAFGGEFGPAGVHRAEACFEPSRYWRGPVWPQLAYLLWRAGAPVAAPTVRGALASGLAEYWDPDTGRGLGAIPQSWTGLALVMAEG